MNRFPWPQENEVHIHRVVLDNEKDRYTSPDEQLRAARLIDLHKRNNFLTGRGLLREILGNYLGLPAEKLEIAMAEHGKPYLVNCNRLHFNLSHAENLFILAITADREIGVDVERLRDDTPFREIARTIFSQPEQQDLFALPDHLQRQAFYTCWTRKEAYLKACGMGFGLFSNTFDVCLTAESPALLVTTDDSSCWMLHDITVFQGFCAALAVKGSETIILYFD